MQPVCIPGPACRMIRRHCFYVNVAMIMPGKVFLLRYGLQFPQIIRHFQSDRVANKELSSRLRLPSPGGQAGREGHTHLFMLLDGINVDQGAERRSVSAISHASAYLHIYLRTSAGTVFHSRNITLQRHQNGSRTNADSFPFPRRHLLYISLKTFPLHFTIC